MVTLSAQDHARLQAAVAEAEKHTGAELVLSVASVSDPYELYPLAAAGLLGLLFAGALAAGWPDTHVRVAVMATAAVVIVAAVFFHWRPLRLALVPASVRRRAAERLARLQFAEAVAGRTHGANGLLIFVALGERYVTIVPDRAIAEHVPAAVWQAAIDALVASVRAGRTVDGLVAAVETCAKALGNAFPPGPGDRNEIADSVIVTDR
jgi:putative membrane protein